MSSAMRELWSDPEFLKIIGTPDANGAVRREAGKPGDTHVVYPPPPPAADTSPTREIPGEGAPPDHTDGGNSPSRSSAEDTVPRAVAGNATPAKSHGPKQPGFRHPGDGEVVPVERAFAELGRKTGIVLESGSHAFHQDIWQNMMGKQAEPPIAFRYAGRIRLDVERLTPEQFEKFKTLERAQRAAIAIGGGDRTGGASGGAAGDSHRTTTPYEHGDTHPYPSNGKGTGGGGERGLPGKTQVSHPPPPPSAPPAERAPHEDPQAAFRYPPKPGDGEVVSIERAVEELGRKSGQVLESGSHSWHRKLWQEQLGNPGEPPVAFKYGGKIRVDVDRLTPEQLETFIKLDQAQTAARAARTGHDFGGGKGSGGAKEASHQALANKVNAYDAKVKKLQEKFDGLQKKHASAGPSKQLAAERASLDAEQKALLDEGETLSMEMAAVGGQELEAVFKTANPKELLNLAHKGLTGRAAAGAMAGIAVTLATAYFIALDVRYILDADNALEALERSVQVGAGYAAGAAEFGLFKLVTGSNLVTGILAVVVNMCGDQAGACEAQEAEQRKAAEAKQHQEQARQTHKAIGDFLAKHVPGSVMWVEDQYVILNQKVWDETVKKIDQMQREHETNRKASLHKRAHDLGMKDARAFGRFVNKDDINGWPELRDKSNEPLELFEDYKAGFKEGNKTREVLNKRASELGYQDGRIGTKAHIDDLFKWPEVAQLVKDGAIELLLVQELIASYNDAFDIKTRKKDPYAGLND
jgi:hypothetical protein